MSPTKGKRTRAEQVRARRQIPETPKRNLKKQPAAPPKGMPLQQRVTTRQPASSSKSGPVTNNSSNRRKVYMPVNKTGTEIIFPSIPNIQVGWRIASGIIFIFAFIAFIALMNSSVFQVSAINLTGALRLSGEEILQQLDIEGKPIVNMIPLYIENKILSTFHDIKTVKLNIGLPASINLSVEERLPAVLWIDENEKSLWIDEEGFTFPVRGEATLPIKVQAIGSPPSFTAGISNVGQDLIALLPENDKLIEIVADVNPDLIAAILSLRSIVPEESILLYDPQYGLGWLDSRGWRVFFGSNTENIDQKLAQYQVIVDELQVRNIQPVLISLEFLHAPYYRLEQ
ncbi:MAG: FtsQ-type POTRA domain-containing protein [Anaerolineaceae bacterium]|nr:FtsQ-type POTRA domain-containing protein [Anaerolineaceae bacterium]